MLHVSMIKFSVAIRVPNLLALLSYLYSTVDVDGLRTTEPILIELPSKQGNKMA